MKIIAILSVILGLVALCVSIYLSIEVMSNYNAILKNTYNFTEFDRALLKSYSNQKSFLEMLIFICSPLSVLLGLFSGFKKYKLGWISVILGVISFTVLIVVAG